MPPYHNERGYDVAPPGTEPPPPGFENEPINRYSRERDWPSHENEMQTGQTPDRRALSLEQREHHPFVEDQKQLHERDRRSTSKPINERDRSRGGADEIIERKRHSKSPSHRDAGNKNENRDRERGRERHDREKKDHEKMRSRDHDRRERPKDHEKDIRREKDKVKDKEKEKEKEKTKEKERRRESTDDDKREKKVKDKRKKKKEEKSLEKKKKKERKEKEKRDKEIKKEQNREKKLSGSKSHIDASEEEPQNDEVNGKPLNEYDHHSQMQETALDTTNEEQFDRSNTPPAQPPPSHENNEELNQVLEYSQDINVDEAKQENYNDQNIDLYADITDNIEYPATTDSNLDEEMPAVSSPMRLKHSDSILDIHAALDFEENDLNESENEPEIKRELNDNVFAPLPELSKWERDDDTMDKKYGGSETSPIDDHSKVTNEVLKRAENAIFARAINAIRPIEIKKISLERQKLYSNETTEMEKSAPPSVTTVDVPQNELQSFQITVPVNSDQAERSVEIKANSNKSRNKTPTRSIKERLGKKITDDVRSRSKTPVRKVINENQIDKIRSRSKDKVGRDLDKQRDDQRSQNSKTDSSKREKDKESKRYDRDRSPEKMTRDREKDKDGGRENRNKDNRDNRDGRDKNNREMRESRDRKENKNVTARSRDNRDKRAQSNSKPISREREMQQRTQDRNEHRMQIDRATRDTGRERELQRARELARIRERERTKAIQPESNSRNETIENLKTQDKDNKSRDKKTPSTSTSNEIRNKTERKDKKENEKLTTNDNKTDGKFDSHRKKNATSFERKRSGIDEASFEPDYDEQIPEENQTYDVQKSNVKSTELQQRGDELTAMVKKRSRSESVSSTSSSDSNSSNSTSDSEDRKRKKRKHKKQKKSKRAASSSGSDESVGKKKKRKSKKSKKKKKTKK